MNIAPVIIVDNMYVQASDNKLRYIGKDRNILMEFSIDFPMKYGYKNTKYC